MDHKLEETFQMIMEDHRLDWTDLIMREMSIKGQVNFLPQIIISHSLT